MNKFKDILEGHINELKSIVGLENTEASKIFKMRESICNNCELKKGNTCNPRLYINPITKEVSKTLKVGFVRGCGCRLSAKQKAPSGECPAKFWGGEFNKNK